MAYKKFCAILDSKDLGRIEHAWADYERHYREQPNDLMKNFYAMGTPQSELEAKRIAIQHIDHLLSLAKEV